MRLLPYNVHIHWGESNKERMVKTQYHIMLFTGGTQALRMDL
jgi:hypothetical protein